VSAQVRYTWLDEMATACCRELNASAARGQYKEQQTTECKSFIVFIKYLPLQKVSVNFNT
jgi:hypothetical protein